MATIEKSTVTGSNAISNSKKLSLSKTDIIFSVAYVDEDGVVLKNRSGEKDFIKKSSTLLRQADMPKAILKRFWVQLLGKRNITLINKYPTDDGSYYWVIIDFKAKINSMNGTFSFRARRILPSIATVKEISKLYHKLLSVEKSHGTGGVRKIFTEVFKR